MSAKIDILTVGYATIIGQNKANEQEDKYMKATGSSCLVRSGGQRILFDTMGPWERESLLERLRKLNIHPDDIDLVVCSHSHPDHIGNNNLFTKAKQHLVGTSVYHQDMYDLNRFEPKGSYTYKTKRGVDVEVIRYQDYIVDKNVIVTPTPGHTLECVSLIINSCDTYGIVALAGDLFERQEDTQDESIWLGAGSQAPDLQRAHRSAIFARTNHILPGHGPLFKVDKSIQL